MGKYWEVFKIAWQENLIYRVNFIFWRVRAIMQLLLVYFTWWTIFQSQKEAFGYTLNSIITYVLVAAFIRAIVLSSRVTDLMNYINDGSVVNFLVKPLSIVKYFITQDLADKLFNIIFYFLEIGVLLYLLKPQIIFQTNPQVLFIFILATIGGLVIYFYISFILSLLSFWVENSWGPVFLMSVFLEGFGGGLFPIDILPKNLFNVLMLTPFPYLVYFPAKIYLSGILNQEMVYSFLVILVWLLFLHILMTLLIKSGLKHYTAVGN